RNLPSNQGDLNAYPDQFTLSLRGTEDYQIAAASHRGKTHAHQGTFREDAVAAVATRYWNILAVADGAGSAPLARIGSNLAVREAVAAMRKAMPNPPSPDDVARAIWEGIDAAHDAVEDFARARNLPVSDLHTTLQLVIHAPQRRGCLIGVVHVGDGIIVAEDVVGTYYNLTEPDTDPEDSGRTLFLTSAKVNVWKRRTIVYDFEQPIRLLAMMTDGLSGDLEASGEAFSTQLFEPLRQRVLCYPLRDRERALLEFISYERRGSFDDRTLLVLSLGD
ncbi:MAG TPA: PP2C family serine/threonine-protein phosphatase, partial [Aggregatilineales bacterium]|nr:PP2C family serine/threonine-protein phosphatase [Aggregatilineales bacterium]